MSIKYCVVRNPLLTDPIGYRAQVLKTGSADLDMLAQRIVDQGTTVRLPDVLAVLENLMAAAESYLLEGFRVNLGGLCELFPRLRGIFDALDDPFDPTRHRLVLGASPGERLRRQFETQAAVERIEASERRPVLLSFLDTASGLIDDTLTPGNIGTISGYRLKVDPAQPDEGIFFIHQVDGAETRVDTVTRNKPGEMIFLVPAIPAGMRLWLEVRARFGEELRTGRLAATLETPV